MRLAAANALVVSVIALVMLFGVRYGVRWALFHEINQILIEQIHEISLSVNAADSEGMQSLRNELDRKSLGHQQHSWFAEIYTKEESNNFKTEFAPQDIPKFPAVANLVPYRYGNLQVIEMAQGPNPLGVYGIRIGTTLDFVKKDLAILDGWMAMAAGTLLIVAPLCGYWLAGRAARTMGDIIQTASRLRPSHLEERLVISGTGDELDQLSHTINGLLDRVAAYLAHNRDFLANAAHELRTPLAAIRCSIEVALNRDQTTGEFTEVLEDLIDQSTSLETLVNQLLLLSETDRANEVWGEQKEKISLHEVVSRAVDMFQGVAEANEIDLQFSSPAMAIVAGHRQPLRQVVNNLIDNAIKYTLPGGKVRVALSVDPQKNVAKLLVSDTGIGISEKDLPFVFDRFFRSDRSRSRSHSIQGTGLGLSICYAVVQAHGGTIVCRSTHHVGTELEVTLPLDDAAAS
ncbi:sensor histidine kinase [Planctomicrobium sp. SH668]|uniref:sensor histidine kinase n=1 Tax=Planctomicrobium sp. SH668 TaxID=3448126 RepID=UPI003F5B0A5F